MRINIKPCIFCFVVAALFFSCSSEKSTDKGNSPERAVNQTQRNYSLEITPLEANRNTALSLIIKGGNWSDIKAEKIEWFVNETLQPSALSIQFQPSDTRKGDTIKAQIVVDGNPLQSNIVIIKNTPPVIASVKIRPDILKPGDNLYVDVTAADADEDEVSITYKWLKNNEPAGEEKKIGVPIKRGDKISVSITPFDGYDYGKTVVIEREVSNMPPIISLNKEYEYTDGFFLYQVTASDQDGDPLKYQLKEAPEGMVINPDTGLVKWRIPSSFFGSVSVTVLVKDGQGGETVQTVVFKIGI